MKLKHIKQLNESSSTYEFVFEEWDGNEAEGLHIQPFDVLVKYHAEAGGHSDHPYGEGSAREYHPDDVHVISLTANEPVIVSSEEAGGYFDHVKGIEGLHALVVGHVGSGVMHRVQEAFPHAARLSMHNAGVAHFFDFMEDHQQDDVIIDLDQSTEFATNPDAVALLKALLDGGEVYFKTAHVDKKFTFKGRLIIVATAIAQYSKDVQTLSKLHPDPDFVATKVGAKKKLEVHLSPSIINRCVLIDFSNERTFPVGTRLQDIPGWREDSLKFFDEKALDNFQRNQD